MKGVSALRKQSLIDRIRESVAKTANSGPKESLSAKPDANYGAEIAHTDV
jgi:hypothetical protein